MSENACENNAEAICRRTAHFEGSPKGSEQKSVPVQLWLGGRTAPGFLIVRGAYYDLSGAGRGGDSAYSLDY